MTPEHRILHALATATDHELYGRDLVAAGAASAHTLYVLLGRMEDRGLIKGREDEGTPPRRLYCITPAGRALLLPPARAVT